MLCRLCIGVSLLPASVGLAQATVINHSNFDASGLSPAQSAKIGQTRSFFAHASVGSNIVSGLAALHASDPARYPLDPIAEDGTPPAATVAGSFYEYARGNPGWSSKTSLFEDYLANGWGSSADIVSNKYCYVDETASWPTIRDSMVSLEATYPNATFIYWTMPLMTSEDADNVLRNQFNSDLRGWMAQPEQTNKVLLDIADIEAWDTAGQQTFLFAEQSYQKLSADYTSDGGHLNEAGAERVAMGVYMAYSAALPEPTSLVLLVGAMCGLLRRPRMD